MEQPGSNQTHAAQPPVEKPMAIAVFGVLNIVFGCYFLVRTGHGLYIVISKLLQKPQGMWSELPFFGLFIIGFALIIWLIVLGIGLLKMKKWARRGSVMYGRIQIVLIVITVGAIIISLIRDMENAPGMLLRSINLDNVLAVSQWIYMVSLLIFMQTEKIKRAFAPIGG